MLRRIFFIVRYSAYTKSKNLWEIGKNKSDDEYIEKLYNSERLDLHQELFVNLTLPSLKRICESCPVAKVLVFTSKELPSVYFEKLKEYDKNEKWFQVFVADSEKSLNSQIDKAVQKKLQKEDDEVCYATVRVDDDDALSPNFGTSLKAYVSPEFAGMGVTFGRGVIGVYENSNFRHFYEYNVRNTAQGLSFIALKSQVTEGRYPASVLSTGNHTNIDMRYPVITDSRDIKFIRTEHREGDLVSSGRIKNKEKMKKLSHKDVLSLVDSFKLSEKVFNQ